MKFADIVSEINRFLDEGILFSEGDLNYLRQSLQLLESDVNALIEGKKLEQNHDKFNTILNAILIVSRHSLEGALTESFCRFSAAYAELVYNWNANIQHDEVLRQLSMFISRLTETRNEMLKAVSTFKDVDDRMRDLGSWSPPAYDIAIDYFEALLEENENRKE